VKVQVHGLSERTDHKSLGQPWYTFEQAVTTCKHRDEQLFDRSVLTDDHLGDLLFDFAERIPK
jgi:hypothetical protein